MQLASTIRGVRYAFGAVKEVLAKANPPKSGDDLAGVSARDAVERVAARAVLADLTLRELRENPVVPYERDELTRHVEDELDAQAFGAIGHLTVGQFREWLLDIDTTGPTLRAIAPGLTPEMAAAACKLMSNFDLMTVGRQVPGRGARQHHARPARPAVVALPAQPPDRRRRGHPRLGARGPGLRLRRRGDRHQPGDRHARESTAEILRAIDDLLRRNAVPDPALRAVARHRADEGARARLSDGPDVPVARRHRGRQHARSGSASALLDEAWEMMKARGTAKGPNRMYFETGQGSALSSAAHHGADQVTIEARAYGLARRYRPFLVNTVVGFIGPEYLEDGPQISRAALEDHFMGKLLGLPMGCDACFTYHARMSQDELESLKVLLGAAGCAYLMALPVGDDIMLNYQSTSYHDIPTLRRLLGKRPTPEFDAWLDARGIWRGDAPGPRFGDVDAVR